MSSGRDGLHRLPKEIFDTADFNPWAASSCGAASPYTAPATAGREREPRGLRHALAPERSLVPPTAHARRFLILRAGQRWRNH